MGDRVRFQAELTLKSDLHSALREVFKSGEVSSVKVRSGHVTANQYIINSNVAGETLLKNERLVKQFFNRLTPVPARDFTPGLSVQVGARICFDNGCNRRNKIKVDLDEALVEFLNRAGLQVGFDSYDNGPLASVLFNQGSGGQKTFNLYNAFAIHGIFEISNALAFKEAIENGVFSRGSYGCGSLIYNLLPGADAK
jgi:hypothetical protein